METLFLLKKKFGSRRVVRNVYEYLDTRVYWMKQYSYVIHNGKTLRADPCPLYENKGIRTAYLKWTTLKDQGIIWVKPSCYRRFFHGRRVSGKLLLLLREMEHIEISFITPLTMKGSKYSRRDLIDNCIENGLLEVTGAYYSTKELIYKLMKI